MTMKPMDVLKTGSIATLKLWITPQEHTEH